MAVSISSPKDEIVTLEYSTLKVPYELLNKKFRAVQKVLDREIAQVTNGTSELSQAVTTRSLAPETSLGGDIVSGILGNVEQRLISLKRKAEESLEDEIECTRLCKARLDHLKSYVSGEQSDGAKRTWQKNRVDRMLVDQLLRSGNYIAAKRLAENSMIENLVDVDIFLVCQRVEEALRAHNTSPCLTYCHENRSKLRRLKSNLEFQVRLQDFIELVRNDRRTEAIKYAKKHFTSNPVSTELPMKDIQMAMGLLAFSPATKCRRYQKLFSSSRWENLALQFRQENFALFQLSSHSMLTVTLQAGLSALKTPQCYKSEEFNSQCPVCSKPFNELSNPLPFSHCSQSYLICSLSGQPMNEHNPPMALPNGYIYGEQALKLMSAQNNGSVTCPRTKDAFKFSEVKKVFVM